MRIAKRALAIILTIATIITAMPLEAFATEPITGEETQEENAAIIPETETEEESEPYIVAEVEEERTETTKTFRMSDGSYALVAYEQPVHYEVTEGCFEEIDSTFEEKKSAIFDATNQRVYENRSGNTKIKFHEHKPGSKNKTFRMLRDMNDELTQKADVNKVSMEVAGETISWSYEGAGSGQIEWTEQDANLPDSGDEAFLAVTNNINSGVYKNAFPYTDLEYIVSGDGIKENIILKDKRANNQWTMIMNIGTLGAKQVDDQTIELYDANGEAVLEIAAPIMTDANGNISMDVSLSMKQQQDTLHITITADKKWLKDKERAYPVTVDPYFFLISGSNVSISDTFLSANMPSSNMRQKGVATGSLVVGREGSTYGKTRSLLKLNTLPQLPAGSVITEANLILLNYYSYSANTSMTVNVHRVTGNWNQSTATWNNSSGLYENIVRDYEIVPQNTSPTNVYNTWEITGLVKGWYEGTIPNYGVMLTAFDVENLSTPKCTKYYSSNSWTYGGLYPTFMINFRCNAGLEDYWTYHSQSVNGGVGYINDYSGNLVFDIPIAGTTGANMPLNLSFVYNSYTSNQQYCNNQRGAINGAGWKINYGQRLDLVENVPQYSNIASELKAQGFHYVWLDGDGTYHFFKLQSDGTYKDEDGLGLTMRTGQSYGTYTNLNIIEDKDGNKIAFLQNGYLLYMGNYLDQYIPFSYGGINLTRIVDGAGRTLTLGYSSSTLVSVTGPDGTVTFNYSGSTLSKINYPDGTTITFGYTPTAINGSTHYLLTSVTGRDGKKLVYTYNTSGNSGQKCRVTSVTEYAADGTVGNKITIDYTKQNVTTFTYTKTSGVTTETYQFDDWGHTTGVVGEDGSTANINYNSYSGSSMTATQLATNNKITSVAAGTKYVNNLLTNHSAEYGTSGWSSSVWATSSVTHTVDNTQSYLGANSFKVVQNYSAPTRSGWRQTLALTPGKTYTFSGYMKSKDVPKNGACGASLYVVVYGGSSEIKRFECDTVLTGDTDWRRLSITFTVPQGATSVQLYAGLKYSNGTAWADCLQLEENDTMSPYNLLENSSLSSASYWTAGGGAGTAEGITTDGKIKLIGSPTLRKYMVQKINVGKADVAFNMRASAKANATPNKGSSSCIAIDIGITYQDGVTDWYYVPFNSDVTDWQTTSFTVVPTARNKGKNILYIQAFVLYYNQGNTAYFDDIMVTMDETGTTYAYDNDGNMITSTDNAGRQTTYTVNNATDMITTLKDSTNTVYSYTYDSANPKKLLSAKENSTGIGFEYTYGSGKNAGNVETVRMGTVGSMTSNKYIESNTEYTSNGAYTSAVYDQRGNKVSYVVDETTGEVSSYTDPLGNVTTYTYDETTKNLTSVTSGGASVSYGYDSASYGNRLKSIATGSATYNFVYDKWSNLQSVNIGGSQTLITNTYENANGNLSKTTYGNGQSIEYGYDKYDRLITKSVEGVQVVNYIYNSNGQLARIKDLKNGYTTTYSYDMSGRVTEYLNGQGRIAYGYDNQDRASKITTEFAGLTHSTSYSYLSANRPGVTTLPVGKVDRTYDSLQREAVHQIYADINAGRHLRSEVTFLDLEGNRTTELVSAYATYVGTSATDKIAVGGYTSFAYTYDANGNITSITEKDGENLRTKTYEYDALNQLIRENDEAQGKTIVYAYDTCGNLLTKTIYPYTTGELGEDANVTEEDGEEETIVEGEEEEISTEDDEAVSDEGTDEPVDETTEESTEEATEEKPEVSTEETQEETSEENSTETEASDEEEVIPEGTEETEENEEASTVEEADSEVTIITYGYEDENWKDKLTSYNGQTITYDGIGNPLSYRDGMHFSWQQGRQLASTTLADGTAISYQYNTDGIRISKTVAGVKTTYFVDASGTIHGLQQGNEILYFLYDSTGRREGFIHYNGEDEQGTYYYVYNAQSDVIGIVDSDFESVVSYEYNSWGKLLSVSGDKADTIGRLNPFRYRGYVYDEESGLYYLNSRYYDPEIGRFINADAVISGVGGDIRGYNQFSYCFNNPINMSDASGNWPKWMENIANQIKEAVVKSVVETVNNIKTDIENFDMENEDEEMVFSSNFISAYKRTIVIKTPFDASFSFGVIGLSHLNQNFNTLNHEYGHRVQLDNKGIVKYTFDVAIPSVTINVLDRMGKLPYEYYSYPWEAEADLLGGVNRRYRPPVLPQGEYTSYFQLVKLFFE